MFMMSESRGVLNANGLCILEPAQCTVRHRDFMTMQDDDSEDLVVDLNTGSFVPERLRNRQLMTEVIDKLNKL